MKGFSKAQAEFDQAIRSIINMGYGLICISHAQQRTYKDENGKEYSKIEPTLDKRGMLVCSRACDIIGYAKPTETEDGERNVKLYLRGTPRYLAGSRFKYMPPEINFDYESLVKAISDAIDKEEKERGSNFFTEERIDHSFSEIILDFDFLMNEVKEIIQNLMEKDKEYFAPRIKEIVEREFGKGKKVNEATRDQVEQVAVVLEGLKDLNLD